MGSDAAARHAVGGPDPKLVVSGGRSPAFDAVCDVLEARLGARRAVVPGRGHTPQSTGDAFNEVLVGFLDDVMAAR